MKEKDILEILALFEQELEEKLQESKGEIERIKYYEKFTINNIDFKNMFITTEKDVDGNITYHMYCGDSSEEIIYIDSDGQVHVKNSDLEKYIDEIDLNSVMQENEKDQERLKGVSEKATQEDIKKNLNKEENSEQDTETEQIEADLQEQGQDLEITGYKKIKDSHIGEKMPEVFENGEEHGIAYSNKLNRFVIMSKINGTYQLNDNVEPAKTTMRTIMSIDEKGEKVERKVPYALMKLPNNPDKEIAVTIGQYGIVDIETVDVLPEQQRLARQVRVEGQGLDGERSYETRYNENTQGKYYNREIAEGVNEIYDAAGETDYELTQDDYIPNTEKTWGELMEETRESLPKLIERYNREMETNGKDSEKAVETIEYDYGNVNREHQQGTN